MGEAEPLLKIQYTTNTEGFLQQLLSKIQSSYQVAKNTQFEVSEHNIVQSTPSMYSTNFDYIPNTIQTYIKTHITSHYTTTIKVNERTFNIHFCIDKELHLIIYPNLNEYVQYIYTWLNVASAFATDNCSIDMNIFLYFTSLKKTLPEIKSNVISREHANTAFTTSCKTSTEINIFRHEEWFKVLIHETFHNMGMDFSGFDNAKADQFINTIFPVNTDVRLYEAYTETFALVLNILHIVCFKEKSDKINTSMADVTDMLKLETQFGLFQVSKIMNHYNLKYTDLFSLTEISCKKRDTLYKEETAVLSYYVIKTLLLYNLNDFIIWCQKYNDSSINFSYPNRQHNAIDDKIQQFCKFIKKKHNDVLFIDAFHLFETETQKVIEYTLTQESDKVTKYAMNTLQMTIFPFPNM